jgi:hypothetical protein
MWLILAVVPTAGFAQQTNPYVSGYVDAEFQSLYMFRGFRFYGNKSAMQITGDVEFGGTGLGMALQPHFSNGGGYVADQRWDYNPYWHNAVWVDQPYMLEYQVNYVYYNYPKRSWKVADQQEVNAIISLPMLFGLEGLAPRYQVIKMWQSKSGNRSTVGNSNGWMHVFGMDYRIEFPGLTPESPTQPATFMAEIVYNDGLNPVPGTIPNRNGQGNTGIDNDWSHFVLGANMDFNLGYNITLTPAVYYQRTMEPDLKSYSKSDEVWFTVGAKWAF